MSQKGKTIIGKMVNSGKLSWRVEWYTICLSLDIGSMRNSRVERITIGRLVIDLLAAVKMTWSVTCQRTSGDTMLERTSFRSACLH